MATDYAALSNDELNRLIAERRGWTDIQISIDGKTRVGVRPGGDKPALWVMPRVATDLNAAVELLRDCLASLYWRDGKWQADDFPGNGLSEHEEASRAVCLAWLRWSDTHPTPAMIRAMPDILADNWPPASTRPDAK